jgi:hypothetical protein
MAVVTHLAVHKWAIRQPLGIAKDLSIDVEPVRTVLKSFKGLFRESPGNSKDHGEHFYSLHLRHSRQNDSQSGDDRKERPPLEPEYLIALLKFVSDKSLQQSQQTTALRVAGITSFFSLAVAAISLFVALHKS